MTREEIIKELTKDVHMPTCCSEEGCMAIDYIEADMDVTCSKCETNNIVKAFCRGIDYQKEQSPWISVKDDLPCDHNELIHGNAENAWTVSCIVSDGICATTNRMFLINGEWIWGIGFTNVKYWFVIPELPKQ